MKQSRRDFLMKGAVVYKLAGSAPPMRAAGPNSQITLGFIGVGIQGTLLFNEFRNMPGVRVAIAADVYDGHLRHVKELTNGAVETTREYRAVIDRKDVDAVVIAVPDHWHRQMTLDALAADKHVYIEKPMTWSIEEGKDIINAVEKSKKLLQVGSQAKTSKLTAKARELVKAGALGKVNMVRMSDNRNSAEGAWVYPVPADASESTIDWKKFLGRAPQRPFDPKVFFRWRCWWEYSGGVATDLFVHLLTTLHEIMDVASPLSVASQGGLYRWNDGRTVPDVMNSIFEYPGGWLADMYVNLANSRRPHPALIMGTEAAMAIERDRLTVYPEPFFEEAQHYGSSALPADMRTQYYESIGYTAEGKPKQALPESKPAQEIPIERGPSHYEQFIICLRENLPSRENATEGHLAAGAAHLANLAYRRGRRMTW